MRAAGYEIPGNIASRLRVLAPWQYVVVAAFGARVTSPEAVEVGVFVDDYLAGLPRDDRRDLLRFLAYVEHVAPLGAGQLARFTALDPDAQDVVLLHLESSNVELIRAGFQALKALALMGLYQKDEAWKAIGYGGPAVNWGAP